MRSIFSSFPEGLLPGPDVLDLENHRRLPSAAVDGILDKLNIGLERPIELEPGKTYHVQMIVDDTIATIYVDGVALNARMYERPGDALSMFVTDGKLTVKNCSVNIGIR